MEYPTEHFDLVVVGGGPAGTGAAVRAATLYGGCVALVESKNLGGCCVNVGCVPSKALLYFSHLYEMTLPRGELARFGLRVPTPQPNLTTLIARKNDVIRQESVQLARILGDAHVATFSGHASFKVCVGYSLRTIASR